MDVRCKGVDKSLQLGLPSVIGKTVVVKPGGLQAVVLDLSRRVPEDRLYKFLMTQPHSSCRHIWHVLRLYHRLVMAGATSEALAESVGSMLTRATSVPGRKVERRPVVLLLQGGPLHFPYQAPQCLFDLRLGLSARPGRTSKTHSIDKTCLCGGHSSKFVFLAVQKGWGRSW